MLVTNKKHIAIVHVASYVHTTNQLTLLIKQIALKLVYPNILNKHAQIARVVFSNAVCWTIPGHPVTYINYCRGSNY